MPYLRNFEGLCNGGGAKLGMGTHGYQKATHILSGGLCFVVGGLHLGHLRPIHTGSAVRMILDIRLTHRLLFLRPPWQFGGTQEKT